MIFLFAAIAYLVVAAVVYRVQYIKTYRAYLRWKAEKPDYSITVLNDDGYSRSRSVHRRSATYGQYLINGSATLLPGMAAIFWLLLLFIIPVGKFLRPEIKAPDYQRIDELEKL